MRLLAGTSGFSYKEWIGEFYPEKLPAKAMLGYYASQLPAVEINNTFYRMPNETLLAGWRRAVPETFRFAVKVPRRVSHIKRLRECGAETRTLVAALASLAPCVGSLLIQLPPFFKRDAGVLREFLGELPSEPRAALEFRNDSWFVDEVFALLAERNCALVQSESDERFTPKPWTADWAYLRLRKASYSDGELGAWLERLDRSGIAEAQAFFKHEDAATGPKLAGRLLELARA
jgi:uncharacterized protein YecE (DUF72 family)